LNLALDATYSVGSNLSGVGVYSRELLRGLAEAQPAWNFDWKYRPHRYLKALREAVPGNVSRGILWDTAGFRRGLFHGLNQRLPKRRYPLQIATFHDLFVLSGDYSTPDFRKRFAEQARHAAATADCIIAVSQFTANQVQGFLGVPASRIRVVHHGLCDYPVTGVPRENIILSVGAIQYRKNTARLIEAFRAVPQGWRLVLAGSAGYGAGEILTAAAGDTRITVTGYVTQTELSRLYAQASIFAFPSLDEGFGMPILEAMTAGIPVVTSNRGAMSEVAGGAALLIDPEAPDEIAAALRKLILDHPERNRLAGLGKVRARQFSWTRAAQETWQIYSELISLPQPRSSSFSGSDDPAT